MLTSTLTVGLSDDRAVAALGLADAARRQDEVDRAKRVLHTVGVMLDAARVEQEAGPGRPPPFGRLHERPLGNAGDLRSSGERPLSAVSATRSNPMVCVSMNARSIQSRSIS